MQFLKTLFWVIVAVALMIFGWANNVTVTVKLWANLLVDVKLWLLVIGPFLLGFVPTWIFHRISLWQERRATSLAAQRAMMMPVVVQPEPVPVAAPPSAKPRPRVSVSKASDDFMTAPPAVSPNL